MLQKIIAWATNETPINTLILLGSRGRNEAVDQWSDYDISVFCTHYDAYTESQDWLTEIDKVWVCVNETTLFKNQTFPTRLVIFEGGIKVDFSFFTMDVLQQISQSIKSGTIPDEYAMGYQVLIDKSNFTKNLNISHFPKPKAQKPTQEEFLRVINEFWFEAYHVAIYLKRNDLWSVKFRSNATHSFLLQMITWHSEAKNNWSHKVPPNGKNMKSWVEPEIWKAIQNICAHFNTEDSWNSLFNTVDLFRKLSFETSNMLGIDYPKELDKNMSIFLLKLEDPNQYP